MVSVEMESLGPKVWDPYHGSAAKGQHNIDHNHYHNGVAKGIGRDDCIKLHPVWQFQPSGPGKLGTLYIRNL